MKEMEKIMELIIRQAVPGDAAELLEFLRRVGAETDNLSFGAEGVPFSVEAEAEFIASQTDSQDGVMLVASLNGRIVGNASLARLSGRMSHRAEFSVAVLKEYWGRGIGGALLKSAVAIAQDIGIELIELSVRSDNERAKQLYGRAGFKRFGQHPAFFKINGDPIAFDYMCLEL